MDSRETVGAASLKELANVKRIKEKNKTVRAITKNRKE